jgi:hypothetical protein
VGRAEARKAAQTAPINGAFESDLIGILLLFSFAPLGLWPRVSAGTCLEGTDANVYLGQSAVSSKAAFTQKGLGSKLAGPDVCRPPTARREDQAHAEAAHVGEVHRRTVKLARHGR